MKIIFNHNFVQPNRLVVGRAGRGGEAVPGGCDRALWGEGLHEDEQQRGGRGHGVSDVGPPELPLLLFHSRHYYWYGLTTTLIQLNLIFNCQQQTLCTLGL